VTKPYRSASGLAGTTVILLAVQGVWTLAFVVSTLAEVRLFERVRDGKTVSLAEATAADDRRLFMTVVFVILVVLTAVAWLMWQHRSQSNVRALGVPVGFSPGWAVGWWFIPIANLWQPFRAVRELWRASDAAAHTVDDGRSTSLLGWWWAVYLVAGFLQPSLLGGSDPTIDRLIASDYQEIASDLLWVVAAVLAIFVVRGIRARQDAKVARYPHGVFAAVPPRGALPPPPALSPAESAAPAPAAAPTRPDLRGPTP